MTNTREDFKNLIALKNTSVYAVCNATNVSKSTVYDWLSGRNKDIGNSKYIKMIKHLKNL